ncbi:GNAT family N-acetyltransferase [Shouchella sp. JSM 1781072]|uniref:GNAT family N-acetyltransferase n=1 Tax=Shouchella sp. JSM 1781072 TaxID=3344581 RepID=UPI0035BFDDAF
MITLKTGQTITPEQLAEVFKASAINRPTEDLQRLETMLQHSNLLVTAWDKDRLVGVARSLTDFSYCCYLSDLAVDRDYQAQGIGRKLIEKTKEEIGERSALILRASEEAMAYYPKLGFDHVDNCFVIPRSF